MFAALRMAFWAAAVIFAGIPVALGIVGTPEQFVLLFTSNSYLSSGRELIFLAIAVLAIGLIDSLDSLLLVHDRRNLLSQFIFGTTCVLALFIILQLVVYAYWSAHLGGKLTIEGITPVLYIVLASGISALFARVLLVSSIP